MAGTLGRLFLELGISNKELIGGLAEGDAAVGTFESKTTNSMSGVGKSIAGLAAVGAIVGIGIAAGHSAEQFQTSTASIATNAGITQAAADNIGKAFLTTAGQVTFSAKEMVDAYAPVAGKLGELNGAALTSAQSLAFMRQATDLAEASGQSLGTTSQALSDVMTAYHMPLSAAAGATNDLFNASRIANVGVDTIAAAVDKMHSKLGDATPSLAVTSGLLVDLSDHGLTGSRGLLQVTSALQTLEKGGKPVDALLGSMGVSLKDAAGNTKPLTDVLAQLQPKLLAMSPAARDAAMQTLFHASSTSALGKVVMEGAAGLQAHIDAVGKVGSAHAAAELKSATLAGTVKKLQAAFSDALVTIGEKMLPAVTKLATTALPLLTKASGFLADNFNIIAGGLGAAILIFLAAYTINTLAAAAATLGLTWPIVAIIVALLAIGAGLLWAYNHIKPFHDAVDALGKIISQVWGALPGIVQGIWNAIYTHVLWAWTEIQMVVQKGIQFVMGLVGPPLAAMSVWWKQHGDEVMTVVKFLWDFIRNIFTVQFAIVGAIVSTAWALIVGIFTVAWNVIKGVVTMTWDIIAGVFRVAFDIISGGVAVFWDLITGLFTVGLDLVTGHWGQAWQDLRNMFGNIGRDITNAVRGLWNDIINSITGFVDDVGRAAAGIGTALINGIKNGINSAINGLSGALHALAMLLPGPVKDALGIHSASTVFAAMVGEPIVAGIAAGISRSTAAVDALKAHGRMLSGVGLQQGVNWQNGAVAGPLGGGGQGQAGGSGGGGGISVGEIHVHNPRTELDVVRALETQQYLATLKARGLRPAPRPATA